MKWKQILAAGALLALVVAPAAGQQQQQAARFEQTVDAAPGLFNALRPLRVAKWTTLAASVGAAAYGFSAQNEADEKYRRLERLCTQDAPRCSERLPDERFADAELERIYQEVVELDGRAKLGLVVSQVGIASSVVLFILDLRGDATPPNVPYEPKGLSLIPQRGGGVELRWTVPTGAR